MLPGVETVDEVTVAAELLTVLERQHGLVVGSLQLIILLESALGVWNIRSIITASPRVTQVGLDERSEEHTSELQSLTNLVCRLLLEKKKNINYHLRYLTTM